MERAQVYDADGTGGGRGRVNGSRRGPLRWGVAKAKYNVVGVQDDGKRQWVTVEALTVENARQLSERQGLDVQRVDSAEGAVLSTAGDEPRPLNYGTGASLTARDMLDAIVPLAVLGAGCGVVIVLLAVLLIFVGLAQLDHATGLGVLTLVISTALTAGLGCALILLAWIPDRQPPRPPRPPRD